MHIVATDLLTCPRCGPAFGLILLADRVEERRVLAGVLGCSNCRERWAVVAGSARLAHGDPPWGAAGEESTEDAHEGDATDPALRWAALLGVTQGPAFVLLAGPAARHAGAVAGRVEGLEVLAVDPPGAEGGEEPGVSRLSAGAALPLASGKVAAAALTGAAAAAWLEEGARVVRPAGRLVLSPVPEDAEARLAAAGCRVLARDAAALVALRE